MYTFAPQSEARRSAQTVLWKITEALVKLVAPILSFTADEVWEFLPKVEGRAASVHMALFPKPEELFAGDPMPILEEWKLIFEVRDAALRVLEQERQAKRIGKGLEADVIIEAGDQTLSLLKRHRMGLKEILNVSHVQVIDLEEKLVSASFPSSGSGIDAEEFHRQLSDGEQLLVSLGEHINIRAVSASGTKCNRCWNYMPEVSNYGTWEGVCTRCHDALKTMGIAPPTGDDEAAA
jgi:isoleucyl-tRNA synthetase